MNQNWKSLALVGLISSAVTVGSVKLLGGIDDSKDVVFTEASAPSMNRFTGGVAPGAAADFTYAAEVSTPAVVHIKASATRQAQQRGMDIFDLFGEDFGMRRSGPQKQESSGSGVIVSADGYIVTNNHVVEGAEELEVVMSNKRTYKAKVIGTDPSTDIAVIQIPAKDLPALTFGNSDAIKVGEWVVAVGNPFNLESTVTAGIVSAKGRGIGILAEKFQQQSRARGSQFKGDTPLESFIQTDAVVNPGNSGGALVNLKGELVGINTAIASPTGSYAGYAFAVPSSLVKKVSSDIIKYGGVQRGYIGIIPEELDSKKAEQYDVKVATGIYVQGFGEGNSAAKDAGLKVGDVITKVDGVEVDSDPKFRELVARKRPGESVVLTVNRGGSVKDYSVMLRNREGGREIIKTDEADVALSSLGAQFSDLNPREVQRLQRANIGGGVKVTAMEAGKLARVGVEEGFVITKVNDKAVRSVKELKAALAEKKGARVQMEGLYLDYPEDVYSFGFNL
ncbi:trypsin-like peptidase domain-containing protein [Runella salmonicolor]|uniref:Trypsin-like peptidase domain-containing protein n=1 Tax=Runella salmonicolor TaxID=2950278 RepID=A0ABT1FW02_9BACT|nr:trypsin-like peptidase domain-containing protein [Runella salmonicolor]MCP1385945.1 trypsin-like peptidase domain-containing protein [Runella salmonicolor]